MTSQKIREQGGKIVDMLHRNGHDSAAVDLNYKLQDLLNSDEIRKIEISNDIGNRCNVRWLGDLFIADMTINEWWGDLEKLKKLASKF